MKQFYTSLIVTLLIFFGSNVLCAQAPLTDRIVIEFMKPGDLDAQARNYNLLPWPEEAKAAAYKAAEIWASYLEITVPIRVKMGWCDNLDEFTAIGNYSLSYQYTDGYYYPLPLINQMLGYNKNKDVVDIICVFKSNLDIGWYWGTDGGIGITPDPEDPNAGYFQKDLLTTMLHEIGHGLGLVTTMSVEKGIGKWGGSISSKANIYDTFLCDQEGHQLIVENYYKNNSESLASVLTSEEVYWNGTNTTVANGGNHIKIHAPKNWITKTSICHLDEIYAKSQNSLMAHNGITAGNPQLNPGYIALGMLQDIGWTLKDNPTANENIELSSSIKVYAANNQIVIEGVENNDQVMIFNISGCLIFSGKGNFNIDIPSGIYIVKVGNGSFKIKL